MSVMMAVTLVFLQVMTAVFSFPMHVSAGEMLGENDFDSGKGLPWHICESATAKMDFEIEDGVYRITIINPGGASNGGEDRWDCQFRHRGLTIVSGHTYHVHYEIKASNSGKFYTKIGNLAGDVEVWHNMSNGYDLDATW
ncbi:MAG: carbohydrate binding domain-containing protein, partial [Lachnospiraceae bacterium]|nr:carbohydrate binding domain-containing protein [Lachnospiraceae bacterium]